MTRIADTGLLDTGLLGAGWSTTHSKLIAHAYDGQESSLDTQLSWCLTAAAGMRGANSQLFHRLLLWHASQKETKASHSPSPL